MTNIAPTLTFIDPYTNTSVAPFGTIVLPPYSSGYNPAAGQTYIFPFTLEANQRIVFSAMHTNVERQDYTLSAWFSSGILVPALFYSNRTYEISLIRGSRSFGIQDVNYIGSDKPASNIAMLYMQPGRYYFQIENRTNYANNFEFRNQIFALT